MNKHAYLSIPADFSVGAVNEMLRLGRENNFGAPIAFDFFGQWEWCLCFESGIVWSFSENEKLRMATLSGFHRFRSRYAGAY
jgi:hypothetical protein